MLNGVDPILIIVLKVKPPEQLTDPPLLTRLANLVGIPIPIYLSERGVSRKIRGPGTEIIKGSNNSGIIVESESRSIDTRTIVEPSSAADPLTAGTTKEPPQVTQVVVDTQVTIEMVASRDSIILTALIAMMEGLIERMSAQDYSIHYINKQTVIFGGKLVSFRNSVNANEDKTQIELVLSTAAKELPTPPAKPTEISNTATSSLSAKPN